MPQLLSRDPEPVLAPATQSGPDQGVIEEARRRQRRRRIRAAVGGLIAAVVIGAIAWALSGGAARAGGPPRTGTVSGSRAASTLDAQAPAFDVRLVPTLTVGTAGWCIVIEEHAVTGGSACGGTPTPASPFLQVYGWGDAGSPDAVTVAVTTPRVAAILIDGRRRVPTIALPGLPYGLRAARVAIPVQRVPPHPAGPSLVALDGNGRPIAQGTPSYVRQAGTRSWRYPGRPPRGACRLRVTGIPGLVATGGQVATTIHAYPGQIFGHAFLPCIDSEYQLQHEPVDAEILLDAAHPGAYPAALPDWKPVRGAPGFFSEGGLTARRSGEAWLIARQGSGLAQRVRLLRHLTATVSP